MLLANVYLLVSLIFFEKGSPLLLTSSEIWLRHASAKLNVLGSVSVFDVSSLLERTNNKLIQKRTEGERDEEKRRDEDERGVKRNDVYIYTSTVGESP